MKEVIVNRKKNIKVCCCVIQFEKKILILRRRHTGIRDGLWEFPGGKQEDETGIECAKREVYEEIEFKIDNIKFLCKVKKEYKDINIELESFITFVEFIFKPVLKVHDAYNWVTLSELKNYDFPEANQEIIDILIYNG